MTFHVLPSGGPISQSILTRGRCVLSITDRYPATCMKKAKKQKAISAMLQQEYHFFKRVSEMLRLTGLRYETTKVMQPDDQRNAA